MDAALAPIPDGTYMRYIATNIANVMFSTAVELAPCSKRPRGARSWCADPDVETEMNAAWHQKEKTKRRVQAASQQQPSKGREDDWQNSS